MVTDLSKWPTDLDGALPLRDAAREIVGRRLDVLPKLLENALTFDETEPEPVHRLRVATRRADAALEAFRPCFKQRRWKRVRKMLKHMRQAAGTARTCDVHTMLLETQRETVDEADRPALDHAIRKTRKERVGTQSDLDRVSERYPKRLLEKRFRKLLRTARSPRPAAASHDGGGTAGGIAGGIDGNPIIPAKAGAAPTLTDAARSEIPEFVDRVRRAGAEDLTVLENLHALRLRCKGLRYALEVFAPCFDGPLRKRLYAPVKQLQDLLGEINDDHEIAQRFDDLASARAPASSRSSEGEPDGQSLAGGLARLAEHARSRRDARREAFAAHWISFGDQCVLSTLDEWVDKASP